MYWNTVNGHKQVCVRNHTCLQVHCHVRFLVVVTNCSYFYTCLIIIINGNNNQYIPKTDSNVFFWICCWLATSWRFCTLCDTCWCPFHFSNYLDIYFFEIFLKYTIVNINFPFILSQSQCNCQWRVSPFYLPIPVSGFTGMGLSQTIRGGCISGSFKLTRMWM